MRLLWKLLRRHVSALQLAGFWLTNLVGVTIVLLAVQLYSDVRPVLEAPDSFMANDYLVLSKEVHAGQQSAAFSADEIDDLSAQPFTVDLGEFTAARYSIMGGLSMMGYGMSTYLFLEAVPDRFLDVPAQDMRSAHASTPGDAVWGFKPGDRRVPIILPRNYLNLYNFGFASTQGLPQMSEQAVQAFPLTLDVTGNGRHERFQGRVVAFSNRLNTILVPESFIEWSNATFADRGATGPSRVIIEVRNTGDEALLSYLRAREYRVEGDGDTGQADYVLRIATGVVSGIGGLITAMSIFVLMLSILLLLQKNTRKLQDLLLLGYTPARVSRPYQLLTLGLNVAVFVCAVPLVLWARKTYLPFMTLIGGDGNHTPAGIGTMLTVGVAMVLTVTLVNAIVIRRQVRRLW